MAQTPEEGHIHKYERVKLGDKGYEVYKCALPGCQHYLRKEMVVGQYTECWRCGKAVVMVKPMARMKKPHCHACTRPYFHGRRPGQAA